MSSDIATINIKYQLFHLVRLLIGIILSALLINYVIWLAEERMWIILLWSFPSGLRMSRIFLALFFACCSFVVTFTFLFFFRSYTISDFSVFFFSLSLLFFLVIIFDSADYHMISFLISGSSSSISVSVSVSVSASAFFASFCFLSSSSYDANSFSSFGDRKRKACTTKLITCSWHRIRCQSASQ